MNMITEDDDDDDDEKEEEEEEEDVEDSFKLNLKTPR